MNKKSIYIIIFIFLVVFLFWKLSSKKTTTEIPVNVISTIPKNNDVFVNEKSEIILTLSRSISNEEGTNLKVESTPSIKNGVVYQENKIRISPETNLALDTKYEIKIKYKEKLIYTLNFETNPFTKEQIESEGAKQTEGDLAFNESYGQFLKDYPWYRNIPIEKKDYTIVYDFDLKSFRIIMNRKIIDATDKDFVIKNAIDDVIKIGVKLPIKNYVLQEIQ